jgi:Predicted hydrolase (metallo-beta-lactamase superfamily)
MDCSARIDWEVTFWDVGQGDATSIKLPDGRFVLIDTGPFSNNPLVSWFLQDVSARRIEAIAVTHNDADHVGGLHKLAGHETLVINQVFLVHDPKTRNDDNDGRFSDLLRPLRARKHGRTITRTLERDRVIAEDNTLRLIARHPDFIASQDARTPNQASSVLSLERKEDNSILVIWGGDALLKTICTIYSGRQSTVLMGPHHGAPQDRPRNSQSFSGLLEEISPQTIFISVGNRNRHRHPARDYVVGATKIGTVVCCSQITEQCLKIGEIYKPVFQGNGRLGLPAPSGAIPCRGAMRIRVNAGGVIPDADQEKWTYALTEKVSRPMCRKVNRIR